MNNKVNIGVLTLILCLNVMFLHSCSEDAPFEANTVETKPVIDDRLYKNNHAGDYLTLQEIKHYSATAYFIPYLNKYTGAVLGHLDSSIFTFLPSSLTAPPGLIEREQIPITMTIESDHANNLLIFKFGPSGCSFEPAAELWISWQELGSENATLYYIDENNQFIEQEPVEIDFIGKRFKMKIHHFSRYAVAYSDAFPTFKLKKVE